MFNLTPFYGESGGQVGDTGTITGRNDEEKVHIIDTQKENELIIQISDRLPSNLQQEFLAEVNDLKRKETMGNHSATHLLHAALREVLGDHVSQKGSLVNHKHLRFDFSHFQKVEAGELSRIEARVNQKIREGIALLEQRNVPYKTAIKSGAMALFGEKYGDTVRTITFDPDFSVELCGGTHVANTSEIGLFKVLHESSVAAGVRRIEAISGVRAQEYIDGQLEKLSEIEQVLGNPPDSLKVLEGLLADNKRLRSEMEAQANEKVATLKDELKAAVAQQNGVNVLITEVSLGNAAQVKDLAFQLKEEVSDLFCVLLADLQGKPSLTIAIGEGLLAEKDLNAGQLVRQWAKEIKGGGGGQAFFAQAGGSDVKGLLKVKALAEAFTASL